MLPRFSVLISTLIGLLVDFLDTLKKCVLLELSPRELSLWRVKSSGVGQSKVTDVLLHRERVRPAITRRFYS